MAGDDDLAVVGSGGDGGDALEAILIDSRDRYVQSQPQPRDHEGERGVPRLAGDHDLSQAARAQQRVQGGGHHGAPQGDAGPGQVDVAANAHRRQCPQRPGGEVLRGGVGDACGAQASQGILRGDLGDGRRPPHDHRGVGQEEWHHQRVGVQSRLVPGPQDQCLAGTGVVTDADLGVQVPSGLSRDVSVTAAWSHAAGVLLSRLDDGDDSAGMIPAGTVRGAQRIHQALLVSGDHERQHAGGAGGPLVLHQPGDDPGGGRRGQCGNHERLQVRPSRARSSWALAGPQEPGR